MSRQRPEIEKLEVDRDGESMRLDQYLRQCFRSTSRAYFQRRIHDGDILLNGERCAASDCLNTGDAVRIKWVSEEPSPLHAQEVDFEIVYEDEVLLVINKPAGLVVHPNDAHRKSTLVHGLLHHDPERFGRMVDEQQRPGIVHRLDKDTSGVMAIAKDLDARKFLKQAFKDRVVDKTYLAIVRGEFGAQAGGRIEAAIGRHPVNRVKMAVAEEGGKPAATRYRVLGTADGISLIEVRLETGRTHQIRVHFAHLHHPIVGDGLYGGPKYLGEEKVKRQMLHAWKLVLPHPQTGVSREYRADPPEDFCEVLRVAGLPLVGECRKEDGTGRNDMSVQPG